MSTFLKVITGLLLTLPLGAYVAGTLVASQAEIPEQRDVVVVESTTTQGPSPAQPTATPSGADDDRTDRPGAKDDDDRDDSRDDRGDDKGGDRDDDDQVQVIRPTPHDVDDDHGGDDDDRDDDDRDDDTDDDD